MVAAEVDLMFPFGVVLGLIGGAAGAVLFGPSIAQQARPLAKALLKAALTTMHEAQVRGAKITETAEDLYAEAKAEVAAEVIAATMAGVRANMATASWAKTPNSSAAGPGPAAGSSTKPAHRRITLKRSRRKPAGNG
jgi:gas vesicle protein